MEKNIGKYGILTYIPKNDLEQYVHKDDVEKLQTKWDNIKLCRAVDFENTFLILYNGDDYFRVTPILFNVKDPQPAFNFGDIVKEKTDLKRQGVIYHVCWHHEKKKVYYLLNINDKKSTKWNFDEDLELIKKNELYRAK